MSLDVSYVPALDLSPPTPLAGQVRARAYSGPAHGSSWLLPPGPPPSLVVPPADSHAVWMYRLVRDRRHLRPVRDIFGNLLYVPYRSLDASADATNANDFPAAAEGER